MLLADWLKHNLLFAPAGASADAAEQTETDPEAVVESNPEDVVESTPDEPVETDDEPEPEVKSFKDYGFETDDPEELKQQFETLRQEREQLNSRAQRAQQFEMLYWQQQQAEHQRQLAAQQEAAKQKQEVEKPKLPWNIPDFDPAMMRFLQKDEATGAVVAIPGADPTLPQKYQEWLLAKEQATNEFFRNPVEVLKPHFEPMIQEQARQIAEQMFQQHAAQQAYQQEQALLQQYSETYKDLYLNADRTPNEHGQMWNQHYARAKQLGMVGAEALSYAHDKMDAIMGRVAMDELARLKNGEKPKTKEEKDIAFLKSRATHKGNKGTDTNGRNRIAALAGKPEIVFNNLAKKWEGRTAKDFKNTGVGDDE